MPITTTFTLPFGIEDADGSTVHREVTMRRVTNEDLILVANDGAVKRLRSKDHNISIAGLRYAASMQDIGSAIRSAVSGHQIEGEVDPLKMEAIEAAMAEMNSVLFARVCLSVGDVRPIDRTTFHKMTPSDLGCIQKHYEAFNTPPKVDEEKADEGKNEQDPSSASKTP
jgi:phage FluMu protein gp41